LPEVPERVRAAIQEAIRCRADGYGRVTGSTLPMRGLRAPIFPAVTS